MHSVWTDVIKPTIGNHFLKGTDRTKRWLFQGRNFISPETDECLHLSSLKDDDHDFVSYREILNLLLEKWITTTDEPLRDSNSI